MKKIYCEPVIKVVEVACQQILSASDPDLNGGNYGSGDPVLSPSYDDFSF